MPGMKKAHFIAIGGSAMHNLALALGQEGYTVTGSDDEIAEPSRSRLARAGMLPDEIGWFPEKISTDIDEVIVGMHARSDNPELRKAIELGLKVYSYPAYLYARAKNKKRVVIGGSHGKTTITSMVLHVLQHAGIDADYMVGAQLEGFDIMVRLTEKAKWMVMEGDEYLTSPLDPQPKFLHYHPHIAVISGIGWDHMNVFPTFGNYLHQFRLFIQSIEQGGVLIYCSDDAQLCALAEEAACLKTAYGTHNHRVIDEKTLLIDQKGNTIPMQIFGAHNMANVSAAKEVCLTMGVEERVFYQAISSFKGASRRLELLWEKGNTAVFRDFAHAPSKVKASVRALREQFPTRKLLSCLELHTFSSLNDQFLPQYKDSLSLSDEAVVFYDPHAVALKRLPAISAESIRQAFNHPSLRVITNPEELAVFLNAVDIKNTVAVFMSSGNFGGYDFNQLKSCL